MNWLVNWLEYFPNTYLHSFFHFLGHNACRMDLPEDQPLYVLQTVDNGSHCCDLLDHMVGCPLPLWTITILKASFLIHFGESSYVNFLHFYRLSFSSLTFTNFFPFCSLFSSYFYLFIDTFICTLLD